jgi:NodT family efflux transporter outer membrane factor (OMF) lipoprotein
MNLRPTALFVAAVLISGCAVGPDYRRPDVEMAADWASADIETGQPPAAWWRHFDDPLLTDLVETAARDNLDVRQAAARVAEARAAGRIADAAGGPRVGTAVSARREQLSTETAEVAAEFARQDLIDRRRDFFEAGFDAAFELDFFGRLRRQREAATARAEAAQEARRGALVTVTAEIARNYFALRTTQARQARTEALLEVALGREDLARRRLEGGLGTRDALRATEAQVRARQAEIPGLEARARALSYAIALLTGAPPERWADRLAVPAPLPDLPAMPPAGLRADLVARRPDVRRADAELAAQVGDLGVAIGERYPRVSLFGATAFQSADVADLLSPAAVAFTFGPRLVWPVFRAGELAANVAVQRARAEAAALAYEGAVLGAVTEVETALVRAVALSRALSERRAAVRAAADASAVASRRVEGGLAARDEALAAQAALAEARLAETALLGARAEAVVAVYKSLGGGWETLEQVAAGQAALE